MPESISLQLYSFLHLLTNWFSLLTSAAEQNPDHAGLAYSSLANNVERNTCPRQSWDSPLYGNSCKHFFWAPSFLVSVFNYNFIVRAYTNFTDVADWNPVHLAASQIRSRCSCVYSASSVFNFDEKSSLVDGLNTLFFDKFSWPTIYHFKLKSPLHSQASRVYATHTKGAYCVFRNCRRLNGTPTNRHRFWFEPRLDVTEVLNFIRPRVSVHACVTGKRRHSQLLSSTSCIRPADEWMSTHASREPFVAMPSAADWLIIPRHSGLMSSGPR